MTAARRAASPAQSDCRPQGSEHYNSLHQGGECGLHKRIERWGVDTAELGGSLVSCSYSLCFERFL